MATLYVSKSGSDLFAGTNPASAKLTMTSAATGATDGDTIVVFAGTYNEQVTYAASRGYTWVASGRVVVDGENVRNYCFQFGGTPAKTNRLIGFTLRRGVLGLVNMNFATNVLSADDCEFFDAPTLNGAGTTGDVGTFTRCIIRDMSGLTSAAIAHSSAVPAAGAASFYDCLFENVTNASGAIRMIASNAGTVPQAVQRCVFNRCRVFLMQQASTKPTLASLDYNLYDVDFQGDTPKWILNMTSPPGTRFNTLNAWSSGTTDGDKHSMSASGDFIDLTKGLYAPMAGGNMSNTGPNGVYIGPLRLAFGISTNVNSSLWTNGHTGSGAVNVTQNASGNIQLSTAGSGTATFGVIDLGAIVKLKCIRLSTLNELYPTDVFDSEINDVNPNYHTVEFRTSSVSEVHLAQQAYTTAFRTSAGLLNIPDTLARWIQIRVTLRTDGVAA